LEIKKIKIKSQLLLPEEEEEGEEEKKTKPS
jgi:hypothetical protein